MPDGEQNQNNGAADNAGRGDGNGQDDYAELKTAIGKERDARRAAESQLDDLKKQLGELDKSKSEMQRLQDAVENLTKDLGERDANLRAMTVKNALTEAATKAGAKYPTLLVSELSGAVEVSKTGEVTNADALVTQAKKAYPELFRVVDGGADGGKGRDSQSSGRTDMNRLIRQQAGYAGD